MSFDYFNTSNLAFGVKLTKAFMTLDTLYNEASANVAQVEKDQQIFNEYINRNYQVPRPTQLGNPCRSDELFNIVNDKEVYLSRLEYKDGTVYIEGVIFKRSTNRITKFTGSDTLEEAYVYYRVSNSNAKPDTELDFEEEEVGDSDDLLLQYRIDSEGHINLIYDVSNLSLVPYDTSQYISMSKGETLATNSEDFTSEDYQCVCIVGKENQLMVYLNDDWIMGNKESHNYVGKHNCILYIKPDDEITGTYSKIFRVNYNTK